MARRCDRKQAVRSDKVSEAQATADCLYAYCGQDQPGSSGPEDGPVSVLALYPAARSGAHVALASFSISDALTSSASVLLTML